MAAQIHAKGVITSLLLDVSVAEDGLYAFGGVLRGSMEMVAVDLGKVEAYHDALSALTGGRENRVPADRESLGITEKHVRWRLGGLASADARGRCCGRHALQRVTAAARGQGWPTRRNGRCA